MLFDLALRRDVWRTFVATGLVLLALLVTVTLMEALRITANGSISPSDTLQWLGWLLGSQSPLVVVLAWSIALMAVQSRLYAGSEMVIWFASGISLARLLRPLLLASLPVALLTLALGWWLQPTSAAQQQRLTDQYAAGSVLARLTPGVFQAFPGKGALFLDQPEGPDAASTLYALTAQDAISAMGLNSDTARIGQDSTASGRARDATLQAGELIHQDPASGTTDRVRFEALQWLDQRPPAERAAVPWEQRPSAELWRTRAQPEARAELFGRLSPAVLLMVMVLLSAVLAVHHPRQPSVWGWLGLGLVALIYFNTQFLAQRWLQQDRAAWGLIVAGVHGIPLALALALLYWRQYQGVRRPGLWPRRSAA
ncbi:LptF/LptG family permease [Amphibiibacter pelophylacis]|uniref:LptF/LptG family permease n=1 Tax=Amphibiibacter pelophylacis TaxID=1799477 RepID=A0ACC6P4B9_9BURK